MKKIINVLVLFMFLTIGFTSVAEESPVSITSEAPFSINLRDMSIDELLLLQSEVQRALADKGYVQYEELERGAKGDSVSNVQERLKELGYYQGSISGKYDSETQKAFKMFEKNNWFIKRRKGLADGSCSFVQLNSHCENRFGPGENQTC